ncbi:MAG: glycoside hydrolase family 71/99 protein [Saccharofermentanales bacterium]
MDESLYKSLIEQDILVGAIRWDGNSGHKSREVGSEELRVLSPEKWAYRRPFFAKIDKENKLSIKENSQAVMDRQIRYANEAGVDYWAFCHYEYKSYLSNARKYFEKSKVKGGLKMSLILQNSNSDTIIDDIVNLVKKPYFQTVMGGRPLLFTYGCKNSETINKIKVKIKEAGVEEPYITVMEYGGTRTAELCKTLGGNALSQYTNVAKEKDENYSVFAENQQKGWQEMTDTQYQVIPWVNTAWDPRPRIGQEPTYRFAPKDCYDGTFSIGTAEEYADQILNAKLFVRNNPDKCPANAIISYSWNEYSEGGTLCPKLSGNRDYLDGLKSVIKADDKNIGSGKGRPGVSSFIPSKTYYADSGFAGMKIVIGDKPVVVNELGRYAAPGDYKRHILKIVEADGGRFVCSAIIDMDGGDEGTSCNKDAGIPEFRFTAVAGGIILEANRKYYILTSACSSDTGFCMSYDNVLTPSSDFSIECAVSGKGYNDIYKEIGGKCNCFGPVSFKYTKNTV